jgi:ABC-type methionine transport system permease subunit
MTGAGKMLVVVGLLVAVVGAVVWALGRAGCRGLPGDVRYESGNVRFYFPVVSCVVLSVILTALMWLWQWLGRR